MTVQVASVRARVAPLMPSAETLGLAALSLAVTIVVALPGEAYAFFVDDQWGFIAALQRYKDPGFAPGDMYVDTYDGASIRRFCLYLVAPLTRVLTTAQSFFVLHCLVGVAIGVASGRAARTLFPRALGVDLIAAVLALAVEGNNYGQTTQLLRESLVAHELAIAFILPALASAFRGRVRPFAALASASLLLHPQIGAETGGLTFAALFALWSARKLGWPRSVVSRLRRAKGTRGEASPPSDARSVGASTLPTAGELAVAFVGFIAVTAFAYLPVVGRSEPIDQHMFVFIVAQVRNPHHMIVGDPFASPPLVKFGAGLLALAVFSRWRDVVDHAAWFVSQVVFAGVVVTLHAGYWLTEVSESRLGPSLQAARLVYLLNWLVILFAAGAMATLANAVWTSLTSPTTDQDAISPKKDVVALLGFLLVAGSVRTRVSTAALAATFALLVVILAVRRARVGHLAAWVAAAVAVAVFAMPGTRGAEWRARALTPRHFPVQQSMARYALDHTPPDAMFLTPPYWSPFRACAGRAIVIDFKSFPYLDKPMLEWWRRVQDVYNVRDERGLALSRAASIQYAYLTESRVLELRAKYGFDYAVVPASMPTRLPRLHSARGYKLIALDPGRKAAPAPAAPEPLFCER